MFSCPRDAAAAAASVRFFLVGHLRMGDAHSQAGKWRHGCNLNARDDWRRGTLEWGQCMLHARYYVHTQKTYIPLATFPMLTPLLRVSTCLAEVLCRYMLPLSVLRLGFVRRSRSNATIAAQRCCGLRAGGGDDHVGLDKSGLVEIGNGKQTTRAPAKAASNVPFRALRRRPSAPLLNGFVVQLPDLTSPFGPFDQFSIPPRQLRFRRLRRPRRPPILVMLPLVLLDGLEEDAQPCNPNQICAHQEHRRLPAHLRASPLLARQVRVTSRHKRVSIIIAQRVASCAALRWSMAKRPSPVFLHVCPKPKEMCRKQAAAFMWRMLRVNERTHGKSMARFCRSSASKNLSSSGRIATAKDDFWFTVVDSRIPHTLSVLYMQVYVQNKFMSRQHVCVMYCGSNGIHHQSLPVVSPGTEAGHAAHRWSPIPIPGESSRAPA